ncbi:hypothetical protein [Salinimicrobium sp. GXAS 041]|uniref:hypothetical protein n=1 Tax=Salinimicrobium sp. GXAS 041 TaxID=3400806 RepID=UPI003C73E621
MAYPIKNNLNYFLLGMAVLFLSNSVKTHAQNYQVTNLEELQGTVANSNQRYSSNEIEELEKLVYGSNATIIISNTGAQILGSGVPTVAVFDTNNLQALQKSNPDFNSVRLLKLKVDSSADLKRSIDLSSLNEFSNLKYILIQCAFNCSSSQLQNIFSNVGNKRIVYMIATPK